jgi:hypothetical protein
LELRSEQDGLFQSYGGAETETLAPTIMISIVDFKENGSKRRF